MKLLAGKKAVILGIANERSIAYSIAKLFKDEGAELGLTYVNEALGKRVIPLSEELGAKFVIPMDVTVDGDYENLKKVVEKEFGHVDILIHSLAFANGEDLKKPFIETSREGFAQAMDISAYSLMKLCNTLKDSFSEEASVLAMTYHGSVKIVKNYNLMGVAKAALECITRYLSIDLGERKVRINCISAGPIRTLAASGIPGFRDILKDVEERSPLKRNVTQDDVANTAVYLASRLSSGVTGQVIYVDSGHSQVAL